MVQHLAKASSAVLCDMREEAIGMKVNKAFSLDPEVVAELDRYARSMETWDKKVSRSKIVNDAIRWYLGDTADLVNQRDALQKTLRERNKQLDEVQRSFKRMLVEADNHPKSWWQRLLGLN